MSRFIRDNRDSSENARQHLIPMISSMYDMYDKMLRDTESKKCGPIPLGVDIFHPNVYRMYDDISIINIDEIDRINIDAFSRKIAVARAKDHLALLNIHLRGARHLAMHFCLLYYVAALKSVILIDVEYPEILHEVPEIERIEAAMRAQLRVRHIDYIDGSWIYGGYQHISIRGSRTEAYNRNMVPYELARQPIQVYENLLFYEELQPKYKLSAETVDKWGGDCYMLAFILLDTLVRAFAAGASPEEAATQIGDLTANPARFVETVYRYISGVFYSAPH